MAQILIRDLDESLVERLERRARRNSRSLEAEVKLVLEQAAGMEPEAVSAAVDKIRRRIGNRAFADTADIIREGRDR